MLQLVSLYHTIEGRKVLKSGKRFRNMKKKKKKKLILIFWVNPFWLCLIINLNMTGGWNVKLCGVVQYANIVGVAIGYTIASAISMM